MAEQLSTSNLSKTQQTAPVKRNSSLLYMYVLKHRNTNLLLSRPQWARSAVKISYVLKKMKPELLLS